MGKMNQGATARREEKKKVAAAAGVTPSVVAAGANLMDKDGNRLCNYCGKPKHVYKDCLKRQADAKKGINKLGPIRNEIEKGWISIESRSTESRQRNVRPLFLVRKPRRFSIAADLGFALGPPALHVCLPDRFDSVRPAEA